MAASPTIYCLENITDYFQFERLCHDLMFRIGYRDIEPLGGFHDRGRDAIHISLDGEVTIFAYSVREDWRAKLAEDADKINRHGHECAKLIFMTTSSFSAGERDEAVSTVQNDYGWQLVLYGLERLRVWLDSAYREVKSSHPQIFPPELLHASSLQSIQSKRYVLINYDERDQQLAIWLARKLTIMGHDVWCEHLPRIGSAVFPEDVESVMLKNVSVVVALYSVNSLQNADLTRQRNLALGLSNESEYGLLLPVRIDNFNADELDSKTRYLSFVEFNSSWSQGLKSLMLRLESRGVIKDQEDGAAVAIRTLLENGSRISERELLFSNCFSVLNVPSKILRVTLGGDAVTSSAYLKWAYRRVSAHTYLSFSKPPGEIMPSADLADIELFSWQDDDTVGGINSKDLVSELIRKSLYVHCRTRDMEYCVKSRLNYVPHGMLNERNVWSFRSPWGAKIRVQLAGTRKYWRKTGALFYNYFLCPHFVVRRDLDGEFVVVLSVRIRIATPQNVPLPAKTAITRRKHLCKDWWNKQWLIRTCALADYLGGDHRISIEAYDGEALSVTSIPSILSAASGIHVDLFED